MAKAKIFIIEREGKPVGAMSIGEKETALLIHDRSAQAHCAAEFAEAIRARSGHGRGVGVDLEAIANQEK